MNVTVIGTGFVGVVTAAVLASLDNQVFALDVDAQKIAKLKSGQIPFYEPKLEDLVKSGLSSGKLQFTTDYQTAIKDAEIIMLAVGTPSAADGTADLKYILAASQSLAPHLKDSAIVAIKSTVPPGTNQKVAEVIKSKTSNQFYVASLPEFLKEGSAVDDTIKPSRVLIGSEDKFVIDKLLELHQPFDAKKIVIKPESAQMAKYSSNAYLAQRITFINQIANLCEQVGADINQVVEAMGADPRIGSHYWYPGLGYGGSCFPKDVKELAAYSRSVGEGDGLFVKLDELNDKRIGKLMDRWSEKIGGWSGKTVAILGLSFKPHTDDMREAPSTKIVPWLKKEKATIKAYDPQAIEVAKHHFPDLTYAPDAYQAATDADVIMLLIEWPELISLDLHKLAQVMKGDWFVDCRNQYDQKAAKNAGLNYISIGR